MILVLFFLFSAFAAFCGLLIYGYRSRAHSAEARANRAEGALEVSQHNLSVVAEIARECVKGVGLNPQEIVPDEVLPQRDSLPGFLIDELEQFNRRYESSKQAEEQATYVPQLVANCSRCNVSVRHDPSEYPVPCPACETLIDPVLDNPPEL